MLRAKTPGGVDQEVYALLVTYQVLRTAMTDATNSTPGVDPDRAKAVVEKYFGGWQATGWPPRLRPTC